MRHMETAAHGPGKKLFCRIPHAYATGIYLHQDLPPPTPLFQALPSRFGGRGTVSTSTGYQWQGKSHPRCLCPQHPKSAATFANAERRALIWQ